MAAGNPCVAAGKPCLAAAKPACQRIRAQRSLPRSATAPALSAPSGGRRGAGHAAALVNAFVAREIDFSDTEHQFWMWSDNVVDQAAAAGWHAPFPFLSAPMPPQVAP